MGFTSRVNRKMRRLCKLQFRKIMGIFRRILRMDFLFFGGFAARKSMEENFCNLSFFYRLQKLIRELAPPAGFSGKKLAKCVVYSDKHFYGKSFFKP